jgi:predicted nucleotidyltransferase
MGVTAIGRPRGQSDRADLVARVRTAVGPVKAVMLYGSEARGSASARSDIDILALVSENPRSTFDGVPLDGARGERML